MMPTMGARNFLVEGVSGTGKTSVCHELRRRGYDAVNGDADLAISLSPGQASVTAEDDHTNHGWDEARVRAIAANDSSPRTFFCGGSRNVAAYLDVFDAVFVLEVDRATLLDRLAQREDGDWGSTPDQRDLVLRLHASGEDVPAGIAIDATRPLSWVVGEILRLADLPTPRTDVER
jgi:hypothetical protein